MKQVLFIHGGEAYSNYDDFLNHLKTQPIDPFEEPSKRWKSTLSEALGEGYQVFQPQMPNKYNAKYEEWKIWFERYFEFINEKCILIGHSQGGYFLAKYLVENDTPFVVEALYLVAAPIGPADFGGEDGGDFSFDIKGLPEIENKAKKIIIVHSEDDPVVPFNHAKQYKQALPQAEMLTFTDYDHFSQAEFPELIDHIKALG